MKRTSLWEVISQRPTTYPTLNEKIEVDIAIIGAGITGVTAATRLTANKQKVALVEAEQVGGVTTSFSTGNLYIPVQSHYHSIASKFDLATARRVAESRQFAIDFIENNIKENNIHCNFARRPWYAFTNKEQGSTFRQELETLKKMDIEVDSVQELPLAVKFKEAMVIPNQARINPLQYVIAMSTRLAEQGCLIFENSRVVNIEEYQTHCVLTTQKGKIWAKKVIMATHTPIGINSRQFFTAPYRSYVVAAKLASDSYPEGQFYDYDRPPHSISIHATTADNKPNILLIAGSHHKTGQGGKELDHFKELEDILYQELKASELLYQWSAQHYQSADAIPYIGLAHANAKRTYIATGFWADGLVYGTLAGYLISELILGKKDDLAELYRAHRFTPLASTPFLVKENSNVLRQYLNDLPLLSHPSFQDIHKGEGKVIEIEREKYAVSRDDEDQLHVISAVCPHMKCIVNWNKAEKTWDCPCHGSRFTCTGKLIEGPAMSDLANKPLSSIKVVD
jgi:glycine/D-amino acid oxidase-like deaminating enzyme/nitrite reductase/ring-hydroxylating ferredoxin subunit